MGRLFKTRVLSNLFPFEVLELFNEQNGGRSDVDDDEEEDGLILPSGWPRIDVMSVSNRISSPLQISDMLRAGFEPTQNMRAKALLNEVCSNDNHHTTASVTDVRLTSLRSDFWIL